MSHSFLCILSAELWWCQQGGSLSSVSPAWDIWRRSSSSSVSVWKSSCWTVPWCFIVAWIYWIFGFYNQDWHCCSSCFPQVIISDNVLSFGTVPGVLHCGSTISGLLRDTRGHLMRLKVFLIFLSLYWQLALWHSYI